MGDTLTVSGGTSTVAAAFSILKTKVASVAVNAAGAGGTNTTAANSCVVTGTTGTGRKFRVGPNTIAAGAISVLAR